VNLDLIAAPIQSPRKTKIVCTLGPACWSEEGLAALMDAGMNVARFNFSHGEHSSHKEVRRLQQSHSRDGWACTRLPVDRRSSHARSPASPAQVLDRVRAVAAAKRKHVAMMLDTKGPEIRTAMLKGGGTIQINKGDKVTVVAVGAAYTEFEGFKDEAACAATIGLSYAKLCQHVKPGGRILVADGSLALEARAPRARLSPA
jgi:pyruvate kinase